MRTLPDRDRDRGLTLVELVVTITLMGLAFAAILGGLGMFAKAENVQRTVAELDVSLRNAGEQVLGANYTACTGSNTVAYTVTPPTGYTASVDVKFWDGAMPATFAPTCPGTGDPGLQRVTITLTRTSDRYSDFLMVGKTGP